MAYSLLPGESGNSQNQSLCLSSKFCTSQSSSQTLKYSTGFGHVFTALLHTSHSAWWKSAARDEVQGLSGGTAPGIEEKQELVAKAGFTLTLAATAQIRISLLLSFLRNYQRERISCPIKQWNSTEYVPTDCLLRVANG